MPFLGIFDQKCLTSTSKMSYLKSGPSNISISKFVKKAKMLKCVTKNGRFRYFRTRIWKQYSHIWNPLPRICVIAKFCRKAKMPKLTTKNAIFGYFWPKNILPRYFWARILKNHCQTWNEHLPICLIAKFCKDTKMAKFGSKYAIFGYFWPKLSYFGIVGQDFQKSYCHISNQHTGICLFAKLHEKTKMFKFGTESACFG